MDVDDYVLVTGSDTEQNATPGEKPEVIAKIKAWLSPTEFDSDTSEYKKHLNAHVQGTGQWILATDQYRRWYTTDEIGDLWIRGIPGSGKSVVAASLVRRLLRIGEAPVLFFFFRHIIISNRSPQSLMRDSSFQLLDHSPSLQSSLKKVMKEHSNVEEVPFDELWKCFSSALSAMTKVYCVVDALDEMELDHDMFLADLLNLGRRNPESIKLALTSRQLPYLEAHLKGSSLVDLRLDRRNVDNDIAIYISHRLENCHIPFSEDDATAVKQAICERGKGLFLYARLMMDQCLQNPTHFLSQLDILPDGLGDMYTNLLREHATRSGTNENFQRLVLEWVTHSARPLRLIELTAIINSLPDRGGLDKGQDAKLCIRSCCGPLLEICEDEVIQIIHHSFTEFLLDPEINHIQMAAAETARFPVINPPTVHKMIARSCLQYLRGGCFEHWTVSERCTDADGHNLTNWGGNYSQSDKELMLRFHFVQYSAQYWPFHAAKVVSTDSELISDLDAFLQDNEHHFESWKDFWNGIKSNVPASLSPLHIAAHCGLTTYIEHLLARGADPNCVDAFKRTPLAYAAMEGRSDAAKVLLEHNAHNDSVDYCGLVPVHHAAKMNRSKVLRILLESGADPIAPKSKEEPNFRSDYDTSTRGETALFYSCRNGHAEALIELQKHVDAYHLARGLHWASEMGRAEICNILLRHEEVRLRINDRDSNGNTPLYLAARARHPATVGALLEHKADVNARSDNMSVGPRRFPVVQPRVNKLKLGFTPLHGWAGLGSHNGRRRDILMGEMREILDLLVGAGCDINARGGDKGHTALFAWSELQDFKNDRGATFISWLLGHGANASVTDLEGSTPLHQARGYPIDRSALRLLIDAGADINAARKSDGQTPLITATKSHQLVDPTLFHEFNAEFDRQDLEGNTALHYACSSWCMKYANAEKWLSLADPTILNNARRHALFNFAWGNGGEGRVDAMSIMIKKGLSLECRDYLGRTPLLHFLSIENSHGCEYFVRELLRLEADVKAKDNQGKSVLHLLAASELTFNDAGPKDVENKVQLMQKLINAGADLHAVDHSGNTIFRDAVGYTTHWRSARSSVYSIVRLGGALDVSNYYGRTAVHIAAALEDDGCRHEPNETIAGRLDFVLQPHLCLDINIGDHQGVTPLHLASITSEINVWKLIQSGADIRARTIQGRTALHYAAEAGKCNIVDILAGLYRSNSLSLDCQDSKGRTPLHEAARSGKLESVKILLDAGAVPDIKDRRARTPLHATSEFEEIPAARTAQKDYDARDPLMKEPYIFHDRGEKPKDAFDRMGLVISSETDNKHIREVVRLLLAAGADPAQLDDNEHTPIDVALMMGSLAVVDELAPRMTNVYSTSESSHNTPALQPLDSIRESLSSFMNQNMKPWIQTLEIPDDDSVKLLQRVISSHSIAVVEEVFRAKSPQLVKADGSSAIHLICRWGLTSMLESLIPYIEDIQAFSPPLLHVAVERAETNIEMVKLLIKCGVDINARFRASSNSPNEKFSLSTAMHTLATGKYWWYSKGLRELLVARADTEIKNESGETALQIALSAGNSWKGGFWCDHTLDILLQDGANVNIVSSKNSLTPLNTALEANRGQLIVQKLLDHGADGSFGPKPAISSAIDSLDYTSLEMLLKAGANPNVVYQATSKKRYENGAKLETPLQNAACPSGCHRRHPAVDPDLRKRCSLIHLLLKYGAEPLLPLDDGATTVFHEICALNGLVKPISAAGIDLETKDAKGRTPLLRSCDLPVEYYHRALESEYAAIELINDGADVHAVDNTGSTTLHYAVKSSLRQTTNKLIQRGVSATTKDKDGLTPLYYALDSASYCNDKVKRWAVEPLLNAGANPMEVGPDGRTPLHFLAPSLMTCSSVDGKDLLHEYRQPGDPDQFAEYSKLYQRFIDAGCDCEARDNQGNTPLFPYVAAVKYYSELETPNPPDPKDQRKMFAEHDIHAVNNEGDTLLHDVARREDSYESPDDGLELFKLLVELGLDPTKENNIQVTALDVAAACGNEDILALYARNE